MRKLTLTDIADRIAYEEERPAFRARVIALKKNRRVPVGDCATLLVELDDAQTIGALLDRLMGRSRW
ncbi:MAG: DUF3501 family protein [candidate division NC10 bacterium]|nr:DUF3501 family protein [candidate division NC10 bacterium]